MQARRANRLVSTLNSAQKADFLRWLTYKLGEKQLYVQQLAKLLSRNPEASPNEIWVELYQEIPYDDGRLRKLSRDLSAWLERYLAQAQLDEVPRVQQQLLLESLLQKGATDMFEVYHRKFQRKEDKQPVRNGSFYRHRLLLAEQHLRFLAQQDPKAYQKQVPFLNYELDQWWMLYKLELACLNALHTQMYGELPEEVLLADMLGFLEEKEEYLESPLAAVYLQLYALLKGDESDDEIGIVELLQLHGKAMSSQDQKNIFNLLLSHFIGQLNASGALQQARRLFGLYQWAIGTGLLLHEGQLSPNQYLNILTVSLRAGEIEAGGEALESLKQHLPPTESEAVYRLGLGIYHFHRQSYKAVIDTLMTTRFAQIFREIQARALLLQAQYEVYGADDEWLHDQLDSFIRYIRGKKLSAGHKQAYLNRFRLFRRLVNVRGKRDLEKLAERIAQTHPLDNPTWIKAKVRERLGGD